MPPSPMVRLQMTRQNAAGNYSHHGITYGHIYYAVRFTDRDNATVARTNRNACYVYLDNQDGHCSICGSRCGGWEMFVFTVLEDLTLTDERVGQWVRLIQPSSRRDRHALNFMLAYQIEAADGDGIWLARRNSIAESCPYCGNGVCGPHQMAVFEVHRNPPAPRVPCSHLTFPNCVCWPSTLVPR